MKSGCTPHPLCRKHLLCPLCAIRRGQKALEAYAARVEYVQGTIGPLKAFHVICTVRDGANLLERFHHLRGVMRKMTQARRDYLKDPVRQHVEFAKAVGGVHSIEVKQGKRVGPVASPCPHDLAVPRSTRPSKAAPKWEGWAGDSWSCKVVPFHSQEDLIGDSRGV